jgi:streptomycin 6-kinase
MLELPSDFVNNIRHSFDEDGERFLAELPALIDEAARRWNLIIGEPFLLSYNYVCAAKDAGGRDVVLKIGVPNPELTSEMEALRLYDGQGAVRLIDSDAGKGMLIEERLRPGNMLAEMQDDEQATRIAAGVMQALWKPAPENDLFIRLENWFDAFRELRRGFAGGTGPLPRKTVETAEGLLADFFAEDEPPVVLHGDFHHFNILQSGDAWLVIDPKGVIGPRGYEVGPLLTNPHLDFFHAHAVRHKSERRIAILAEQLGMERSRIRGWGIAHAVLSAYWDMDEKGNGWENGIHAAELFMSISA